MELSWIKLTTLLIVSFIFGCALGVLFGINKIVTSVFTLPSQALRLSFISKMMNIKSSENIGKVKKIFSITISFFQDIFCMLVFAIGVILLNYYYNDGKIRGFAFLGMLIGFVLYNVTLGKPVNHILKHVFIIFIKCVDCCFQLTILPIKLFFTTVFYLCVKFYQSIKKRIAKMINMRYNVKETQRLTKLAKIGFLDLSHQKD